MFEDEYRNEMKSLYASEQLIASTLKKMHDGQSKLQAPQFANHSNNASVPNDTMPVTAAPSSRKKTSKPLLMRVGIPLAACAVVALVGVLVFPQIAGVFDQNSQQHFEFPLVAGSTSIDEGLQFGSIGQQPSSVEPDLKCAKGSEAFLPEGILDARPIVLSGQKVYLGYDQQQSTYYAAYLEETSSGTWMVLQSANLDEAGFVEALKNYFMDREKY